MNQSKSSPTPGTKPPLVALAGNPNTGKTTLFNALTGLNQQVGNYPGVTVEISRGVCRRSGRGGTANSAPPDPLELADLPGTYSLAARSPDEMVATDLLLGLAGPDDTVADQPPAAILNIVDAANLERHLYLTTQLLELGRPVVVALNMMDLAAAAGITVDVRALSAALGVAVVPIQANTGQGLDELVAALRNTLAAGQAPPQGPVFPPAFEAQVATLQTRLANSPSGYAAAHARGGAFMARRLLCDVGGYAESRLGDGDLKAHLVAARAELAQQGCGLPALEPRTRYAWIRQATTGVITRPPLRPRTWTDRLDAVLTHRLWGTVIFMLVMGVVFQSIFVWAKPAMDLIENGQAALADAARLILPDGPLADLVVDGLIGGVGAVVIFVPQIAILFVFVAILEDCGYMARAAFLMDRLMSRAGLSGKSFIPLLSSVACAIPGIMATRVIENPRDRLVTILVAPLMSCSARLPVYALMIAAFVPQVVVLELGGVPLVSAQGLTLLSMYMIGFVAAPIVAWVLKGTLVGGQRSLFIMEMPTYKWPSVRGVGLRVTQAVMAFLVRAGTVIFAAMILVWAALYFPRGDFGDGRTYPQAIAELTAQREALCEALPSVEANDPSATNVTELPLTADQQAAVAEIETLDEQIRESLAQWKAQSFLGRAGRFIEPVVIPLGWDWKIGMAALASFPAREVIVGTLSIIYGLGDDPDAAKADDSGQSPLAARLAQARHPDGSPVFTLATALSIMVFFALCAQCTSTLAVIRRETNSWVWPIFSFVYMTGLAYGAAFVVYQVASRLGG